MAGEKCFYPKLKAKLKPGFKVYAFFFIGGLFLIACGYGLQALSNYLSTQSWAVTTGNDICYAVGYVFVAIITNFTLVLGMIYTAVLVWAYIRLKEGRKQTVYSDVTCWWMPAGLTYFLVRILFWTHLWIYDGKQANAGVFGVLIGFVAFITIWSVCGTINRTVLECFTDPPVEAKTT
jgi:hypothetical protein